MTDAASLPLAGIRVVEFVHMIMGPSAGLILGELVADQFYYRWTHPDPRMETLHAEVASVIAAARA